MSAPSLVRLLSAQPFMQVVRGLLMSPAPRHLRDLAAQYGYSPAGVSDIVRRLKDAGVLTEKRTGNRLYLSLELSTEERESLMEFFTCADNSRLRERATRLGEHAADKLAWMDEAFQFHRSLKRQVSHDPT
jgi:DNA-binding MarR family transcriptional regulator